ncbi:hypothetical protein [Thalassomonas sp. M1454]|uniref:hypothetical protein n=1 Tax=Thalassomonas sp. M1454 TaxID=2594477 RepID=UPI00117E1F58|nr:hypothetical protein [Thalassomonas sp. M1454]TRX53173.1 hypothetical protein FNN08_15020 [Thalassomonas sp. M1454]
MKANTKILAKTYPQEGNFTKKKVTLLALVLWLHITILDLFVVTSKGPQLLWQDNIRIETLVTHILLVALSVLSFIFIHRIHLNKISKSLSQSTSK